MSVCQHEDLLVDRFELLYRPHELPVAEQVIQDIESVSPETRVQAHRIPLEDAWDFEEVFDRLYGFAREYSFRTDDEDYFVHITTGSHVEQICLFLLAESRHLPARLLQTSPPGRRDAGPGRVQIIDLDLSRYDALAARFSDEHREGQAVLKSGIETRNAEFNRLIDQIERVAVSSREPILLTGPTGAGKSQLARSIYDLKRQREQIRGQFVEVNCATLRGDQAMSALFGHVKGAFTGATSARPGLLRAADGGIVFLDEIGELGLDEQAMLLRAIEEKRFLPVGSDREQSSDFQVLAGTNRDLSERVREGRFRDDLLARINLWTFPLPGLAARTEDIAPNLDYELERFARATGRKVTMNVEARRRFLDFAGSATATWSGNFRDLNAAVTRMATLAAGGRIRLSDVDDETDRLARSWQSRSSDPAITWLRHVFTAEQIAELDLFDRVQLNEVIRVCVASSSLSEAGRRLFAVSRLSRQRVNDADRLRKYLSRFGLEFSQLKSIGVSSPS